MMESVNENCLPEPDISLEELLSQYSSENKATSLVQNNEALKNSMRRLKQRIKNVSEIIEELNQVKEKNKDLEKHIAEVEDKNIKYCEELKTVYNERNVYYTEVLELRKTVPFTEECKKIIHGKDYSLKLNGQALENYSTQVQALKMELNETWRLFKKCKREKTLDKKRSEKTLTRVLKDHVPPTTQRRDRWLQTLMAKYVPSKKIDKSSTEVLEQSDDDELIEVPHLVTESKEELSNKTKTSSVEAVITDSSKHNEVVPEGVLLAKNSPKLRRNASVDFDYAGSVDTGCGSSLAMSDGEKSFYSPDYYMHDSPLNSEPNLCNKCSVKKIDASTSPIIQETADVANISTGDSCNRWTLISKRDACNSPIPSQSVNVAADTADLLNKCCTLGKEISALSKEQYMYETILPNITSTDTINIPANATDHEKLASNSHNDVSRSTLNLDGILTTKTDDVVNNVNKIVGNAIAIQLDILQMSSNELTTYKQLPDNVTLSTMKAHENGITALSKSSKELPTTQTNLEGKITPCHEEYDDNTSRTPSPEEQVPIPPDKYDAAATHYASIFDEETSIASVLGSDTEDFHNNNTNIMASPVEVLPVIAEDYDNTDTNGMCISSGGSYTPSSLPSELREKECLELNNSHVFNDDVGTDSEIQSILNKMQPREALISPIPTTPQRTESSPRPVVNYRRIVENQLSNIFALTKPNAIKELTQVIIENCIEVSTPSNNSSNNDNNHNTKVYTQNSTPNHIDIESRSNIQECVTSFSMDSMQPRVLLSSIPTTPPQKTESWARPGENRRRNVENKISTIFHLTKAELFEKICQLEFLPSPIQIDRHNVEIQIWNTIDKVMDVTKTEVFKYLFEREAEEAKEMSTTTELRNSTVREPENDAAMTQRSKSLELEYFEQMTSRENNNHEIETCETNHNLPETIQQHNDRVIESNLATSLTAAPLCNNSSNNDNNHITNVYTQNFTPSNIDIDSRSNIQECVTSLNMDSTPTATGLNCVPNENGDDILQRNRSNIMYENDMSGNDADNNMLENVEQSALKPNNNETQEIHVRRGTSKTRNLTKLEKMRLKMVPKGKIKHEVVPHKTKKPRFKPKPIVTVPKKKVTEADSAASLNDKSVYENAVRVINAPKMETLETKKLVVVLEHCSLKSISSLKKNAVNGGSETNKTSKSEPPSKTVSGLKTNNTNLSTTIQVESSPSILPKHQENVKPATEMITKNSKPIESKKIRNSHLFEVCEKAQRISDPNETMLHNSPKKCKRKRISTLNQNSDGEPETLKQAKDSNVKKSESCPRKLQRSSYSFEDSDSEPLSVKRNCKARHSSDSNELLIYRSDNTKRVRLSSSDCKNSLDNSKNTKKTEQTYTNNYTKTPVADKITCISPTKATNQMINKTRINAITSPQRILRSSTVKHGNDFVTAPTVISPNSKHSAETNNSRAVNNQQQQRTIAHETAKRSSDTYKTQVELPASKCVPQNNEARAISYADLSLFSNEYSSPDQNTKRDGCDKTRRENVLCRMIQKHGVQKIHYCAPKYPDAKVDEICNKLDTSITRIIKLPQDECQIALKGLVADIRSWNVKHFLVGLIKYLRNPQRKIELFKKVFCPPAPRMTKVEQVLLYVIDDLEISTDYRGIVKKILTNIEYILFALNKTPEEINVIESMSHFYALLCRSYQKLSKLRSFLIDAMYCLQFKSIIVIKQCLEVWPFVLPLGDLGLAKTPLVASLVFLLHFYKCDERQDGRIQELRYTLKNKYNYDFTDWNENKILDLFRIAVKEVKDNPVENKMLRLALLILGKRYGAPWCQKNIVKKILIPMITDKSVADVAKQFCVSVLGPLVKPYPNNMKVHCEMTTDLLLTMLDQKHSQKMQEAIITSLLCLNKQNNRVIQFLLKWNTNTNDLSPEFVLVLKDYVRSKTVKAWKTVVSQMKC